MKGKLNWLKQWWFQILERAFQKLAGKQDCVVFEKKFLMEILSRGEEVELEVLGQCPGALRKLGP